MGDNTWEKQATLISDGHAGMVLEYLKKAKLTLPAGLEVAAQAAAEEAGIDEQEESGADPAALPPVQPPILPVDRAAVVMFLILAIGGEKPNGVHARPLKSGASEAQRLAYERSHVTNPDTQQVVHKRAALSHRQKQLLDSTPGAGRGRYITGELQPIIAEDKDGTGFACDHIIMNCTLTLTGVH